MRGVVDLQLTVLSKQSCDARGREDKVGALLRVVRVDRDVGCARSQDAENRDVEVSGSRRHTDAHPVPADHTSVGKPPGDGLDRRQQITVGQDDVPIVDRRRFGVPGRRLGQNLDECALRRPVLGALKGAHVAIMKHRRDPSGCGIPPYHRARRRARPMRQEAVGC